MCAMNGQNKSWSKGSMFTSIKGWHKKNLRGLLSWPNADAADDDDAENADPKFASIYTAHLLHGWVKTD